jgi:hypothetical protein
LICVALPGKRRGETDEAGENQNDVTVNTKEFCLRPRRAVETKKTVNLAAFYTQADRINGKNIAVAFG